MNFDFTGAFIFCGVVGVIGRVGRCFEFTVDPCKATGRKAVKDEGRQEKRRL